LKISDIAKKIDAKIIGNPETLISGISSLNNPKNGTLILVKKQKHILELADIDCFFLAENHLEKFLKNQKSLIVNNSSKTFSILTFIFNKNNCSSNFNSQLYKKGKKVKVGKNCLFGMNVVLEDNVSIGENVSLSHNVVIKKNVIIGNNVVIDSGTIIGSEGFGNFKDENHSWHHFNHLGNVRIGDNVSIGSNCCIDRGTIDDTLINDGVIIDNLVHIAHNVIIGENTAIAAKVGIAGSCIIGKRNMIGGMVGIIDHIETADDVIISATSTVHKNILEPGHYTGIMPISKHYLWKRIALQITKLDKMMKFLKLKKK